jgi:hypothetical protein
MSKSNYEKKTLPELYVIASQKGVKSFFGKNEEELREILGKLDEEFKPTLTEKVGKAMGVKKKSFAAAKEPLEEEDLDSLDDILDIDPEPVSEPVTERVNKKLDSGRTTTKTNRKDIPEVTVEDDVDDFLKDLEETDAPEVVDEPVEEVVEEELLEDEILEEEVVETKPQRKVVPVMAKKPVVAAPKAVAPVAKVAPKAAAPVAKAAPKATAAPAAEAVVEKTAPYKAGTAGHCAFVALKKGGTMEGIVKLTDALIAKAKATPPSNTAAKIKIIMTEINSGKKGAWGKFVLDGKKITYTA